MQSTTQQSYWIVGLGREGWSSYQYLRQQSPTASFFISDDKPADQLSADWQAELHSQAVTYVSLDEFIKSLPSFDQKRQTIVLSPGIPLIHPVCQAIIQHQIQPTSNTELFLIELQDQPTPPILMGVTGTKGKSTTASLVHHVLKQSSKHAYHLLAGNIGTPPLEILSELRSLSHDFSIPGLVVLELSSHQLRLLHSSPHIAVVQNISNEHLDHFGSFESYLEAKSHLVNHQIASDYVVFNPDLARPSELAQRSSATPLPFVTRDKRDGESPLAWIANEQIVCADQPVISVHDLPLLGKHNWENVLPAVVIAHHFGVAHQAIAAAIRTFQPLKHRLQKVAELGGVLYVNDSMATAPSAAAAALTSFPNRPIIAIAGGYDRGLDLTELSQQLLASNLRGLILFPTTGQRIEADLHQLAKASQKSIAFPIHHVASMEAAVTTARQLARAGDVVLLAPGAASFGLFKDYADRGDQFISQVKKTG